MVTKQINKDLQQLFSKISFSQLIDQIPGYIFIKDTEGVCFACSQVLKDMAQGEVIGKTDYDLPWKDQADHIRENDKKVMQS